VRRPAHNHGPQLGGDALSSFIMRLGIDFGTTRTIVAVADRGNYPVVTFENAEGDFQEWYPCLVAINGKDRRYGFDAVALTEEAGWTIHRSFKRLLDSVSPNGLIFDVPVLTVLSEFLSSLRTALETQSNITMENPLEVAIGVPANSNSNQRFLTIEAFRLAGFNVVGVFDEPSAAGIEYAHRYRSKDLTRKREHLLVYDLGGGTFDCSAIRLSGDDHSVLTSFGINKLGGDDFDAVLLEMAEALSLPDQDRLLEICRQAKEKLNPNSKKIPIQLGEKEVCLPVDDYYARCAPSIHRTLDVVDSVMARIGGEETLSCIYIVGGGSEFPPVSRAIRTRFGRRARKSSYAHAATAIGLAIAAGARSEIRLDRTFSRNFGVWREAEFGTAAFFDMLFPKGCHMPALSVRRYHPAHNIGHFRYLECDQIDDTARPAGDIAPWDDIVFPFEPQLLDRPAATPVRRANPESSPLVEEVYECDENGIVRVTIRNLTAGYDCAYALRR
jgi:molecular chaperone DnaK (HSP70)